MKTIVVGYDETEPSQRALERAAEIAEKFGSTLIVTSIAGVMTPALKFGGAIDPTDPPELHAAELAHAREYLGSRNVTAEFVRGVGDPADGIVEIAEQRNADLIVVGTRERGLLQRLVGQSVSQSVAHHAHRDVLIVH